MDNWRLQAACRPDHIDPDWFHPTTDIPIEAMRVCVNCPVRTDCLNEALNTKVSDDSGVWGGTTALARIQIRQGRLSPGRAMGYGNHIAQKRTPREKDTDNAAWRNGATA